MEEILASIRRIMADDENPQVPTRPRTAARPDGAERMPVEGPGHAGADARGRRPVDPARVERRPVLHPGLQHPASVAPRPLPPEAAVRPPQRAWLDEADEASLNDAAAVLRQSRAAAESPRPTPRAVVDPEPFAQAPAVVSPPRETRRNAPAQVRPQVVAEQVVAEQAVAEQVMAEQLYVAEPPPVAAAQPHEAARRRDLLSPNVDAAIAAAFRSLGDVVLPQKERTIEDLVKEILRPMLKDWLDANLPAIVEDLVRAEIERVARRPR